MSHSLNGGSMNIRTAQPAGITTKYQAIPITSIRLDELHLGDGPRSTGVDENHVQLLMQSSENLPPILVQSNSMRVVDGMHRVCAARLNGQSHIEGRVLGIEECEALNLGVRA